MNRIFLLIVLTFAAVTFAPVKPRPLFDGKSFAGWEGNKNVFRIEDGSIVGGSMKAALPNNEFLCTSQRYSDFVLRAKFKVTGERVNAGIQFRSERIPNDHEVIGYQADVGQNYWGALYDESRRKKVLVSPDAAKLEKVLKRDDWNEYVIRAEGKRIRLEINGYQTVDYTETDGQIKQNGIVCLQIHAGPPSEARYKDITIEELSVRK
ncbi:MAG: 3-keto-disaccharide hydrolase [Blastocatellia bacterium]